VVRVAHVGHVGKGEDERAASDGERRRATASKGGEGGEGRSEEKAL
jgi:hypothetical protein